MIDRPAFFAGTGMPDPGWWEALWPDPVGVLAAVGLKPGTDVVDLCSGDGWFTLPIARVARSVAAIDIDPNLLEVARKRPAEGGATNCEFILGNAYDLPALAPRPADFVFLANAFHGVPDRPRLSRAIHATLKPGGRLAIVNWHQRPREETVNLWGTARAEYRAANVAGPDHRIRGNGRIETRANCRGAAISLWRDVRARCIVRTDHAATSR